MTGRVLLRAGMYLLRRRRCTIQERPAEDAAEVVRIKATNRNRVFAGLELARQIHVPLELIIAEPPGFIVIAVRDHFAVDIQPRFVEHSGEHHVRLALNLIGC